MIAVGNDIVDLKAPEAIGKSRDIRFIEKVLTAGERGLMIGSSNPDALLWGFWAAKEAAYKTAAKSAPDISSTPIRYAVTIDTLESSETVRGWVRTPLGDVPVMVEWHADYVHARAAFGPPKTLEAVVSGSGRIPKDSLPDRLSVSEQESLAVRKLAAASIAQFLGVDENTISIIRPESNHRMLPPEVRIRGEKKAMDLSLSHDGRFAAFAFYHHRDKKYERKNTPYGNRHFRHRAVDPGIPDFKRRTGNRLQCLGP